MKSVIRFLLNPRILIVLIVCGPLLLIQFEYVRFSSMRHADISSIGWNIYLFHALCLVGFFLGISGVLTLPSGRRSLDFTNMVLSSCGNPRIRQLSLDPIRQLKVREYSRKVWRLSCFLMLLLSSLGVFILFYTLGPGYVVDQILNIQMQAVSANTYYSNEGFSFSADTSGFVRMFGYLVVSAIILWAAIAANAPFWLTQNQGKFKLLFVMLLFGVFIRTLLAGDRSPVLGALIATVFAFVTKGSIFDRRESAARVGSYDRLAHGLKWSVALAGVLLLIYWIFSLMSILRGFDARGTNPFFEYVDLSVANTTTAISTDSSFTYGFSTLLAPLVYVIKALDFDLVIPQKNAGNLVGSAFGDFGYFGFLIYTVIGLAINKAEKNLKYQSVFWTTIYIWFLFGLITTWAVPIFGGPDYWAGFFCCILAAYIVDKKSFEISRQRFYELA